MNLELRHLRYVAAVADTLNFTRAANTLHMSQPALSARIKDIETHLGTALFERTTRSVSCTTAGEQFVQKARAALELVETAERQCRRLGSARTLTVGYYGVAGQAMAPIIIDQFHRAMPDVEVDLRRFGWADPTAGLREGRVDLAFVRPPFHKDGLSLLPLFSETRVVGLPSSHRFAGRHQLSADELLNEPVVTRRTNDKTWAAFWSADQLRQSASHCPARVEVDDIDDELQAVAAGRAITFTTEAARKYFPRPGVTYVPVTGLPASGVALAWRASERDPLCRSFIEATRQILARDAGRQRHS